MRTLLGLVLILGISSLLNAQTAGVTNQPEQVSTEVQETLITSDLFEMVGGETENYFYFQGNVVVTGTNLRATCDTMEVVADREQSAAQEKAVGKVGTIQSILMTGNVVVEQSGRRAEAGRADILPREDKVVLTESPKVYDSEGTVSGWRITLFKGERRALVEGDPDKKGDPSQRPRIQLPAFQDLGFEDKDEAPANPTSNFVNESEGGQ